MHSHLTTMHEKCGRGLLTTGCIVMSLMVTPMIAVNLQAQNNPLGPPPVEEVVSEVGFEGTYEGDDINLILSKTGTDYVGELTVRGTKYPVTGSAQQDGSFKGVFTVQGKDFPLTLAGSGDAYVLSSAGKEYKLEKEMPEPKNPLANDDNEKQEPVNPFETDTDKPKPNVFNNGKRYLYHKKYQFDYPSNWTLTESNQGTMLSPPDLKTNENGPEEYYALAVEPAGRINKLTDPFLVPQFDSNLQQSLPFLKRTKDIEINGDKGFIYYEGTNPAGQTVIGRIHITLKDGQAIYLMTLGIKEVVAPRMDIVTKIFNSMQVVDGKEIDQPEDNDVPVNNGRDSRLIGTWYGTEKAQNQTMEGWFTFTQDGAIEIRLKFTPAINGKDGNTIKGTWEGTNGTGVMTLNGQASQFTYEFITQDGKPAVKVTTADGNVEIYTKLE